MENSKENSSLNLPEPQFVSLKQSLEDSLAKFYSAPACEFSIPMQICIKFNVFIHARVRIYFLKKVTLEWYQMTAAKKIRRIRRIVPSKMRLQNPCVQFPVS